MTEPKNSNDLPGDAFRTNSERVEKQKNAPIRIIIGNPPYSIGQKSANDNAQNQKYPLLDTRVETTYANSSKAGLRKALYDPYIKAFRWATDRLENRSGIICFVSNAGWLDGNALDGFRNSLEKEFSSIYVFDLTGNCRTSAEQRRREGDNIFGLGSRTPISITLLVKQPKGEQNGKGKIFYYRVADYMKRGEKLKLVKDFGSILNSDIGLTQLIPNEHGDWLNQRNDVFSTYIPVEPEKKFDDDSKTFFSTFAIGVATNRDAWVYNFSKETAEHNVSAMIDFYNEQRKLYHQTAYNENIELEKVVSADPLKISWTRGLKQNAVKNKEITYNANAFRVSLYRPFAKKQLYFHNTMLECPGLSGRFFPKADLPNMGICISGIGGNKPFSVLMTDVIPCMDAVEKGQCFPRYYYEEIENAPLSLFDTAKGEYKRKDAITDFIFQRCRELYGPKTSRDDIFYYVYGLLHSEDYRNAFAADLKKMLPRIPLVDEVPTFRAISKAGRELAELHLNYETQPEPENILVNGENMIGNDYRVSKMVFGKKKDAETGKMVNDPSVIIYNHQITIENIPSRAYDYIVNGKSAIEWVMEWYSISEDKKTGIVNDPNKWAEETNNERYILTLLLSIINVSCKTVDIVSKLPKLTF